MNEKPKSSLTRSIAAGLLFVVSCFIYEPAFQRALSTHTRVGDFFQEWASARNYFEGLPIYTLQEITAWRYLQYKPDPSQGVFVRVNGHPPTCVLLGLPFAKLPYADAFLIWNVLSLVLLAAAVVVAMKIEGVRYGAVQWATLCAVLFSNCLLQQLMMGQLGTLLLLLIVGTALAEDRGRPITAGVLLGSATALKLFPALLFLYFVVNRKWRTVAVGAAVFVVWNAVSVATFGFEAYSHYLRYAVPEVMRYRDWWANYSITGLWFKLFDGTSHQTEPLWFSPLTAQIGALVSLGVLVLITAYACQSGRANRQSRRSSFALVIAAMVLASPVAWDHYFLLLMWPLMRLAHRLPRTLAVRGCFDVALFLFWLNPIVLWIQFTESTKPTPPAEILLFISWPFYAVLTVFAFTARQTFRDATAVEGETSATQTAPAPKLATIASA